jgi:hypothetical protein
MSANETISQKRLAELEAQHRQALAMLQRLYDHADALSQDGMVSAWRINCGDYTALKVFLYPDVTDTGLSIYDKLMCQDKEQTQ